MIIVSECVEIKDIDEIKTQDSTIIICKSEYDWVNEEIIELIERTNLTQSMAAVYL